jgi:hypothetical protein
MSTEDGRTLGGTEDASRRDWGRGGGAERAVHSPAWIPAKHERQSPAAVEREGPGQRHPILSCNYLR